MIEKEYDKKPLRDVEGLPIGVAKEGTGELVKTVSFIPWGWKEEKEIAKVNEEAKGGLPLGEMITQILVRLLNVWGPYKFQDLDLAERELHLRNSFFADVFIAYILLRIEAMGELVILVFYCPYCGKQINYEVDLRDIDVFVPEIGSVEDAVRRFHVAPPMRIGEAICTYVDLRPMRWEPVHCMPGDLLGTSDPRFLELAFADSVIGAEGVETHGATLMIEERLESLRKIDITRLAGYVDDTAGGPDIGTNLTCPEPKCKKEFRAVSEGAWGYNYFFDSASLPKGR